MIAGKTLQGVQAVNEIIRSRKLNKFYLTLVAGEIHEAGEITAYLTKDAEKNQVRISKREGSGARTMTKYRPLAHAKGYSERNMPFPISSYMPFGWNGRNRRVLWAIFTERK